MPRVLLLSTTTGYQLRSFDEAASRLGLDLIFATDRCHQLEDPWRDRAIAVRFHEEESSLRGIVEEAKRARIDGILAVGDRPVILAARAAARLGLPGHPPHAAAASGNKRETRARLARAGLAAPWNFVIEHDEQAHRAVSDPRVKFPCVLKPLALSGSRGVIRADNDEEFVAAFERIRRLLQRLDVRAARTGLENAILVEGFIAGQEVAVEAVLSEGSLRVLAIFDKPDPLDGPFFEETIYVTPSRLGGLTQLKVMAMVEKAAAALGLWHGPIHAECRLSADAITVLEVAARPIGGLCSKAVRFETGKSLEEVLLRQAIGDDISTVAQDTGASAVMMIPIPKRGVLKRVDGVDLARAVRGVDEVIITAKSDQLLEPLPEAGSYLGFIFARAREPRAAEAAVRAAHERLAFAIEPEIRVSAAR